MNILLVTMEMNIGGAETHVLELAKALKKIGNNVYVISAGGKLVDELEKSGVKHVYAPLKDKKINHILTSIKILKQIIIKEKIDVVHAHARIPGALCGMVCKQTKTLFVTTIHGTYRVNAILKLLTNWGEKTLAVSEDIREYALKEYKLKPENVYVTVNGIDTEKLKKQEVPENLNINYDKNKKVIVHISRLDKDTSQVANVLLDVAKDLDKNINGGVQIIIVGSGNNYDTLINKAQINKISNVIFTGGRTDVHKILNIADIFVGVSRAALEAMACEVPVILAGNEANGQGYQGVFKEEILEKSRKINFTCRGLPKVDSEILKNDIINLFKTKNEEMGKYNRKVITEYYSVEKMVEDAINIYAK